MEPIAPARYGSGREPSRNHGLDYFGADLKMIGANAGTQPSKPLIPDWATRAIPVHFLQQRTQDPARKPPPPRVCGAHDSSGRMGNEHGQAVRKHDRAGLSGSGGETCIGRCRPEGLVRINRFADLSGLLLDKRVKVQNGPLVYLIEPYGA